MGKITILGGLALSLAMAGLTPVRAEAPVDAMQTLADKAEIGELVTRYYYDLNHGGGAHFADYFTDDAELVTDADSFKGRAAIEAAFDVAEKTTPARKVYALEVLLHNPLIVVHGDTASARAIFTEAAIDKQGDAPHITIMGREYDRFVKRDGKWRFVKRQITMKPAVPADWQE